MNRVVPLLLLLAGAALAVGAASRGGGTERISFAPLVELAGRATQSANRATAQALGVTAAEEAALGAELDAAWSGRTPDPAGSTRVEAVFRELAPHARKPFPYHLHVVADPTPNAVALPGGVLLVTTGLLHLLGPDDAALAGVLAHELGHVELSHGLDAAAWDIAARRRHGAPVRAIGQLRDALVAQTYSQTQEAEADAWAFDVLVDSPFDPGGLADAFAALARSTPERSGRPSLLRDYLRSHPPIAQREARARALADAWRAANPDERRRRTVAVAPSE